VREVSAGMFALSVGKAGLTWSLENQERATVCKDSGGFMLLTWLTAEHLHTATVSHKNEEEDILQILQAKGNWWSLSHYKFCCCSYLPQQAGQLCGLLPVSGVFAQCLLPAAYS
jgi:hypothetical protein